VLLHEIIRKEVPMDRVVCCVCENSITGQVIMMGNRPYHEHCYAKVVRNRRSLWWTSLAAIGALVAFVLAVAIIVGLTNPHVEGGILLVIGLGLALVPALLWLAFFYMQDALEPEPKQLVLGVFALGGLLAQAIGIPIVQDVFRVSEWMNAGAFYRILGAILVVGFTQQFLIYASVRYSVYLSAEFDERVDGIIYATAAALGYATVLNVRFVVDSGGVDLVAGIIRIAVTTMALASFGGLLGYFLGRCKFEDEPLWWMPAGLALAAALDGLFTYVRGEITTTAVGIQGGGYNPWPGLILGMLVAGLTFGVLFYVIRRLERQAPQTAAA